MPSQAYSLPLFLLLSLHHCVSAQLATTSSPPPVFNPAGCSTTKGCLFKPSGCTPYINCTYALSYRSDSQRVYLELLGAVTSPQNVWVAVGFSSDQTMGDDSVTECSSFNGSSFSGRLSYNPGHSNRLVTFSDSAQEQILTTYYAGYSNGVLYCRLSQQIVPTTLNGTLTQTDVRSLNVTPYLLMASGSTSGSNLKPHAFSGDSFPLVSSTPLSLTQYIIPSPVDFQTDLNTTTSTAPPPQQAGGDGNTTASASTTASVTVSSPAGGNGTGSTPVSVTQTPAPAGDIIQPDGLTKAHGILMLSAWMVFLTSGILSARFLRDHWPESRPVLNSPVWFLLHRGANLTGFVLFTTAFIFIHTTSNPGSGPNRNDNWSNTHGMIGFIACILGWFQPINALIRCRPGAPRRFIFNLFHGGIGYIAWILATTALVIALFNFGDLFYDPSLAMWIFYALVAFILVVFVMLEVLRCMKSQGRGSAKGSDINQMAMAGNTMVVPRGQAVTDMHNGWVGGGGRGGGRRVAEESGGGGDFRGTNLLQAGLLLSCIGIAIVIVAFEAVMIILGSDTS